MSERHTLLTISYEEEDERSGTLLVESNGQLVVVGTVFVDGVHAFNWHATKDIDNVALHLTANLQLQSVSREPIVVVAEKTLKGHKP